jgi:transposase
VYIEACGGSHYWAREIIKFGHEVRLIAPQNVKPYLKRQKNDMNDAAAIAEAGSREQMRFVAIKQEYHQEIQTLHRVRSRHVKNRTALMNEIGGLLLESGIAMAKGHKGLVRKLRDLLYMNREESGLSDRMVLLLQDLFEEYKDLNEKVASYDAEFKRIVKDNEYCQRIIKIPGIGPVTATAMLMHLSDWRVYKNGREFSASLGLVPRQHSSGGKTQLLSMSKKGNPYLRTLLIHGARSALGRMKDKKDCLSVWAEAKKQQRGSNKACVALANKVARIVWSMAASGESYHVREMGIPQAA